MGAGERCIDKVVMVEETEYDDVIECKKVASDETIKFCNTPLICEGEGPEECKTVYESQCETRYHEHDVEDDVVELKPSRRRSVRMSPKATPLRRNVPSGQSRSVNLRRRGSRSILPKLSVRRYPVSFAAHLDVSSSQAQRSALTKRRLLLLMSQRRPATWSPKRNASMSQNWCHF